jgi:MFS family permease
MGVALVLTGITSRVRRDRLLRWSTGLRMILLAAAALLAASGQPPAAVIAAGAASSALAGTYRPLQAAVLPWLVRTPAELAASNAVTAVMENSGALAGPLLAGGLLAVAAPAAAIAAAAGVLAATSLSLLRLTVPDTPELPGRAASQVVRDVTTGLAEFLRMAPPGGVAILAFAQTFLRGALVVLIAVLAVHVLALGGSAVGWLTAAFGVGGLVGGAVAAAAVRVTRLGRSFIAGMLVWGLPLAFLALRPTAAIAYLALVIVGIGNAIVDVSGFTLVTRLAGPRTAGKTLGALEFVALAGLATGSILTPLLLQLFGTPGTLALLGGGLAGLALAHAVRFRRLDQAMPPPDPEAGLLVTLPMFAPPPRLALARRCQVLTGGSRRPGRYPTKARCPYWPAKLLSPSVRPAASASQPIRFCGRLEARTNPSPGWPYSPHPRRHRRDQEHARFRRRLAEGLRGQRRARAAGLPSPPGGVPTCRRQPGTVRARRGAADGFLRVRDRARRHEAGLARKPGEK